MGKRSTGRKTAMQALYAAEFGKMDIKEAFTNLLSEESINEETKAFAEKLAFGAWQQRDEADKLIKKLAKGWKLERIGGVDRTILRLAIFELTDKETPAQVVINEAIELAKKFSTDESAKFVNGILGAYLKNHS